MRKLGHTASDSLDLLLDTMCSMFGGIILIAILIVLLTQGGGGGKREEQRAGAEIIARKIAVASADLEQARQLRDRLAQGRDANLDKLAADRKLLMVAVEAGRAELKKADGKMAAQVAIETVNFTDESLRLSRTQAEADHQAVELRNSIKTQAENAARLKERLIGIDRQIQQAKEERVAKLRFPKERLKTKASLPIILKYNRIYPLYFGDAAKNTESITWEDAAFGGSEIATPIRDKGLDPQKDRAEIATLLGRVQAQDIYFALYVYVDSFDAFKEIKEFITQSGFDFGWEPVEAGVKMRFGSNGHSPPPL